MRLVYARKLRIIVFHFPNPIATNIFFGWYAFATVSIAAQTVEPLHEGSSGGKPVRRVVSIQTVPTPIRNIRYDEISECSWGHRSDSVSWRLRTPPGKRSLRDLSAPVVAWRGVSSCGGPKLRGIVFDAGYEHGIARDDLHLVAFRTAEVEIPSAAPAQPILHLFLSHSAENSFCRASFFGTLEFQREWMQRGSASAERSADCECLKSHSAANASATRNESPCQS